MNADEPLPTRRSLLDRLKDAGDHASWEDFHRTYRGLLGGVARRAGLNEHEAEEVVQDTFIAVAKRLPEFRYEPGKDSFKGWLLQIVRWKVADQWRKRRNGPDRSPPGEESESASIPFTVPGFQAQEEFEAIWDAEWAQHLLTRALARVKRQVNPEHYAIYHLHVIEGQPPRETARALGVNLASVYLAKLRVGRRLREEIRRLEMEGWENAPRRTGKDARR